MKEEICLEILMRQTEVHRLSVFVCIEIRTTPAKLETIFALACCDPTIFQFNACKTLETKIVEANKP